MRGGRRQAVDAMPAGDRLYVCGPKLMLDAVLARVAPELAEHVRSGVLDAGAYLLVYIGEERVPGSVAAVLLAGLQAPRAQRHPAAPQADRRRR